MPKAIFIVLIMFNILSRKIPKTRYYYREADFTSMIAELTNDDWCSVLDSDNIEDPQTM